MDKRLHHLFLLQLFLIVIFYLPEKAIGQVSFIEGDLRYSIKEDNTLAVAAVTDATLKEFVIPAKVTYEGKEYNVTSIASLAFESNTNVTTITLPEGIIDISWAFTSCINLATVNIPGTIKKINGAFRGCASLESITVPGSLDSFDRGYDKDGAFAGCTGLKSVVISPGITRLDPSLFSGCTSLVSIEIPEGVKVICGGVFQGCTSLTSIKIPESIEGIGGSYYLPPSWETDGPCNYGGAFEGCTALQSIEIPDKNTFIDTDVFKDCTGLKSIKLPAGLTEIVKHAFQNCTKLASITFPSKVEILGNEAFLNCTNLTSVEIPPLVKTVDGVFKGCTNLTSVTIPKGITSIDRTFNGCSALSNVTIPNSVTSIIQAFIGCSSLRSVDIPNSVTDIQEAFVDCTGLTSVKLPNSLTELFLTFSGCSNLTDIEIPKSITSLHSAFKGCTGLKSISIPESVKSIGNAFVGCTGLKSIVIPNSVTDMEGAFEGCSALEDVEIPEGITDLYNAFVNCTNLSSVQLPSSVTKLLGTFEGCTALKSIDLSDNVKNIDHAFKRSGLVSIVIPEGISSMVMTFENCKNLKSVTCPVSMTDLGRYTFQYCTNLEELHLNTIYPPVFSDNGNTGTFIGINKSNCIIYVPKGALTNYTGWAGFPNILEEGTTLSFKIACQLQNLTTSEVPATVEKNKPLIFTLTPATNYKLPATIAMSMGGIDLEAGTAYTYDATTGKVSIPAVTGDIVIKADGVADKPLPPAIGDTFTSGSLQYIVTADKTVGVHKATDLSQSEYILPATIEQGGLTYKITTIEAHAFDIADIQLTSVKIPEGVISIGEDAFVGCEKLAHVELPSTVLTIDKSAFAWCSSLTSFTVPANLKVIDDRVFRGSGLVSVIISAGVESIRDLAFGDCNALKEINMQGMTPPQLDYSEPEENCACGHPFEQVNKTTCKVYVPRGSASAYAGWGGFTSILEEGNSPQSNDATLKTLSYRIGTDSPLEIQSFSSGQYEYTVELPEKTGSEAQITLLGTPNHVAAKLSEDNTVNLVQGKGTVTLQVIAEDGKTTKSYTVHFEVSVPKAIIPDDPNEEIVVGADNTYTDSRGNTSVFNGEVGSGTETTLVGKLTFDNPESGTASTSIILNKVRVGDMNSAELSTLVTSTTGIVINLKGENSLGKLVNNGSISLESIGDAILMNTVVENNGVFTDKTSSLAKVEGPASLDITPPEDNEVAPGSTTTLSASTATGTDYAVTFTWEEQQPDGSWTQTGTPNTYTPTRSGLRAGGIMIKDELTIKASESGKYRCVIMNKVGAVSTMLTTQPATVTVNSTVGNAVIDNRKSVRVQDGVLYIQVSASELIQIVNYSGTIVRSLRLPIGETRVENLQHGFYIIKFEDKQTQKVTVR